MKKILISILSFALLFSAISCKTSEVKSSKLGLGIVPEVRLNKTEIVEYQGSNFGAAIPEWVLNIAQGNYNAKSFENIMPDIEGKKIFVKDARGNNLSILENETNLAVETEIASKLEKVIGDALTKTQKAFESSDEKANQELSKQLTNFQLSLSNVSITGVEKISSYWILFNTVGPDGKVIDSYYDYYVVYGIDKKDFNAQVEKSLDNSLEISEDASMLKDIVRSSIEHNISQL